MYACNIGSNKYIVQVTTVGVRLLFGKQQLQHIPLDLGSPIVQASSADPHVALLTADGQVVTLVLKEIKGSIRLAVTKSNLASVIILYHLLVVMPYNSLF